MAHPKGNASSARNTVLTSTYRYVDRGFERSADFPVDRKDDVAGVIASASSGPLRDYQDKLKAIQLRERGLSKGDIAEKIGRSEYWVKRWWREHPATLERPAGANDVVLQKASLNSFRDLDIRRSFAADKSLFGTLVKNVPWRQAKVVARDHNTGELGLRFNERGQTINAGRQVADYVGGIDVLDKLLQKTFSEMDIRDPQARVFMNYYADGQDRTGTHRHDFWTCLLSFGSPRILTVDNKPILLRDGDLVVFGTQNHGVPVMPDVKDGRISLVIFFYPDADNLERQWQTITEEDDEKSASATMRTQRLGGLGVDHGFNAALLWGEAPAAKGQKAKSTSSDGQDEKAALASVLDPNTVKRSLVQSPNSELNFQREGSAQQALGNTVFSVACFESPGDAVSEEKEFFRQLQAHDVHALWDLRLRARKGSWCSPEALRQACAVRIIKYRCYALGKREAGGPAGHVRSEEGQDVLRRLLAAAAEDAIAYLTDEDDWRRPGGIRAEVADALVCGELGTVRVLHISRHGVEEHPPPPARAATSAEAHEDQPPLLGSEPPAAGHVAASAEDGQRGPGSRWGRSPGVAEAADTCPSSTPDEAPKRASRWGKKRAEA